MPRNVIKKIEMVPKSVHLHPDIARGPAADVALIKLQNSAPKEVVQPIKLGKTPAAHNIDITFNNNNPEGQITGLS